VHVGGDDDAAHAGEGAGVDDLVEQIRFGGLEQVLGEEDADRDAAGRVGLETEIARAVADELVLPGGGDLPIVKQKER
jgi:hypothetical protein